MDGWTALDHTRTDEEEQIVAWRYRQLVAAGSDKHHAQIISERTDVSLHKAIDLLEHECSPTLMVAILL